MRRPRPTSRRDEENPYWVSFTDLMTAMLTLFVLAVVVLVLQVSAKQGELAAEQKASAAQRETFAAQIATLRGAEDVRRSMLEEIAADLAKDGIKVRVSEDGSVLNIPTSRLGFASGSWEIGEKHEDDALAIGRSISQHLRTDDRYKLFDTVFVEGHTDDVQHSGLEGTGNWGLSTFRAISLWRLWEDDLTGKSALHTLEREDGSPLFSVSGYGDTRPATAGQKAEKDRAANRRIDVRFTVRQPTADDLADVLDSQAATTP